MSFLYNRYFQFKGQNYMLPVWSSLPAEGDVIETSLPVMRIKVDGSIRIGDFICGRTSDIGALIAGEVVDGDIKLLRGDRTSGYELRYGDNFSGRFTLCRDWGGIGDINIPTPIVVYNGTKYSIYNSRFINYEATDIAVLPDVDKFGFFHHVMGSYPPGWLEAADITDFIVNYTTERPFFVDPYEPEGESEGHVGGEGTHEEEESDPIPIPPEPTLSAANTNFIRLYNPTLSELQSLANYMWSDLFDLNTFKKIFSDPISCILGLSIVPVAVRNGGTSSVVLGNIDTEVLMNRALSQYETVDCGSLTISEYWGAYLDYSPYTKFELYLPYIGIRPISADDIMGKTISVTYRVDILSGSCVAFVKCDSSVLYSFIGQCSSSIPITGNDWTNVINGAINIAGAVGTLVATGGFSAPAQIAGTAAGTAYQAKHLSSTASSLAQNVTSMKPQIEKSGSLSGTGGMLGVQKPYLIITRPKQALPARQNHYMGYPSFVTVSLGDVSGYTEIDSIHLENIPATSEELNEIERLLKGGVIL